jgi:capsid protein
MVAEAESRGNEIIHGVEVDKKGQHIRYYVANRRSESETLQQLGEYTVIEARGKNTGKLQAYLVYGSEYRIDNVRGLPLLSAVLEKMKKLDRYNEAVVAGAEEGAKVPYTFEHTKDSDGTNPDLAAAAAAMSGGEVTGSTTVDMTAQTRLFKRTYEKEPINLPIGTQMKRLGAGMETEQEAFVTGNFIFICAAVELPYEVALMKYVNSFSSSRMASQTWLTLLKIKRIAFNDAFNKPFYDLFLDVQILTGKIKADGYFSARNKGDVILLEAYRNARFTGPGVPQADPGREVKAEISKIEANLTTHESAMERLDNGHDFDTTIDRLAIEKQAIMDKIPTPEPTEPTINNGSK